MAAGGAFAGGEKKVDVSRDENKGGSLDMRIKTIAEVALSLAFFCSGWELFLYIAYNADAAAHQVVGCR